MENLSKVLKPSLYPGSTEIKQCVLILITIALISAIVLSGCSSSAQKIEDAKKDVINANKDLDEANQEYLTDVEKFKKETADKISENKRSADEFRARKELDKENAREDYERKINELEQKNSDMQKRLDDYQANGKEKWDQFKSEFNNDMEKLGKAFKDLTVKNS